MSPLLQIFPFANLLNKVGGRTYSLNRDLIIIGGNRNYFANVRALVQSLRNIGCFTGDLIICDNGWRRGAFGRRKIDGASCLTAEQREELADAGAATLPMQELAEQAGLDVARVLRMHTQHHAHPLKFAYCTLIGRLYEDRYKKIAFCDGDVFCQAPFSLDFVAGDKIHVAGEGCEIGATRFMSGWMRQITASSRLQEGRYAERIAHQENLCTGFLAGNSGVFAATCELLWNLGEIEEMRFHSDQPLFNYAVHWLRLPYTQIHRSNVCHLANVSPNDLHLDEPSKNVWVRGEKPALVHYHGPIRPSVETMLQLA